MGATRDFFTITPKNVNVSLVVSEWQPDFADATDVTAWYELRELAYDWDGTAKGCVLPPSVIDWVQKVSGVRFGPEVEVKIDFDQDHLPWDSSLPGFPKERGV